MSENLNDLEMAKKRDYKIMITDAAINKVFSIKRYQKQNMIIFVNWQDKFYKFLKTKMIPMK